MSTSRRARAWAAAGAVALLVALGGCAQDSGAGEAVVGQGYVSGDGSVRQWERSERAEPVTIEGTDFAGKPVSTADWAGDVVVVNTWYASCAPCRKEAPGLVELATDREADGVRVLGINTQDDAGAAHAFERTFGVPYPSIADADGKVIARLSGVVPLQAVPTTVILDREHRPAARVVGEADPSTLKALIDEVLAEADASAEAGE